MAGRPLPIGALNERWYSYERNLSCALPDYTERHENCLTGAHDQWRECVQKYWGVKEHGIGVPCDVWTRSMLPEIEGGWAVGRCGLREAFGNMIGLSDPI